MSPPDQTLHNDNVRTEIANAEILRFQGDDEIRSCLNRCRYFESSVGMPE